MKMEERMTINVLEWLDAAAKDMPQKTALADEKERVSYSELLQNVKRIASYIINCGSFKNRPIAVLIDRNIRSIELFLGVVASGNFYVPVDFTLPRHRIELIFQTLQPVMVLQSMPEREKPYLELNGTALYSYEQLMEQKQIAEEALADIREAALDTDPLYAIFTSGSTGIPKGVLVNHRSVVDLVEQFQKAFAFPKEAVFGNQAPFDFDVSVKDIYNALRMGATVEVIPKKYFSFPGQLIDYLNDRSVDTIIWAVSALHIVENFKTFEKSVPKYLRLIMFSGEVMPVKVLKYWQEHVKEAQFVNLYGPTEITCNCTYYIVDREFSLTEALPIGRAFRNTQVYLWNSEDGRLVTEPGEVGEICVRGTCLALGYYGNPEKTKEAFTQSPFQNAYEEKVYHTGDLGSYNARGELMFASRRDYQIKHMGHRIELGEVEIAVNALPFIENACCLYDEAEGKIVLFYQAAEECKKEIALGLADYIPKYMFPNRYEYYEKLPMSEHGKIDRVRLKKTLLEKSQKEKV